MNLPLDPPAALLALYSVLALVAALVGGVMPTLVNLTHTRLQVADYFLCIAGADLLPGLRFHAHDRVKLSLALLAGVAVALLIVRFGHAHPMSAADLRPTPWVPPFCPAMRGNGALAGCFCNQSGLVSVGPCEGNLPGPASESPWPTRGRAQPES